MFEKYLYMCGSFKGGFRGVLARVFRMRFHVLYIYVFRCRRIRTLCI